MLVGTTNSAISTRSSSGTSSNDSIRMRRWFLGCDVGLVDVTDKFCLTRTKDQCSLTIIISAAVSIDDRQYMC
jgi:hypothetical protein